MSKTVKYRAFLSYSHADSGSAKRVHGRIENFQIDRDLVGRITPAGPVPQTLRPIFRDRHDFDAGVSLTEQTISALDDSASLIVLASPHAARSKFVNEEVRQFKLRHPDRPVIPLIVDGEPGDAEKECFPPALRYLVVPVGLATNAPADVIAADLREKGDGPELALAKVVARMIGLAPDDVYRRAERERRRKARQRRWVRLLIYVLLLGIIGGLIGWINQVYIEEQITWFTRMRPYMLANVRPYVVTSAAELALRPFTSFRECAKDCPEMIVIPAGEFLMGSSPTEKGYSSAEGPQHQVSIGRQFAVSKYDVTFEDWAACVSVGGCPEVDVGGKWRGERQPVVAVSWNDAKGYVVWFSKMTGKSYRLLTEAEWEYAARAGTKTAHFWGDDMNTGKCNGCGSNWDRQSTSPVGSFEPNAFGLYDMEGDVWQWVQDCYYDDYKGAPTDGSAWSGGDCGSRTARGGSFNQSPLPPRIAVRVRHTSAQQIGNLGFRVARTLSP